MTQIAKTREGNVRFTISYRDWHKVGDVQELYDMRHILPATISNLKAEA